ncbi:MAG: TRAP transporter small permease subunit [Nocardioidaceae bacterium]
MSDQGSVAGGSALRRVIHGITLVLAALAVLCIVVMLVAIIADVTRRALAGKSVEGVVELGEVMMVAIVFLGLGYAEARGTHVSMTLLIRKLSPRWAGLVNAFGLLIVIAVVGWMVYVTADRALLSFETQEYRFGLVRVPVWPARIAVAVGLAVYFLELVLRLIDDIQSARGRRLVAVDGDRLESHAIDRD